VPSAMSVAIQERTNIEISEAEVFDIGKAAGPVWGSDFDADRFEPHSDSSARHPASETVVLVTLH